MNELKSISKKLADQKGFLFSKRIELGYIDRYHV